MIGRKGQGALEYLLILAGVIAIAVVVIVVAHNLSTSTNSTVNRGYGKFNETVNSLIDTQAPSPSVDLVYQPVVIEPVSHEQALYVINNEEPTRLTG